MGSWESKTKLAIKFCRSMVFVLLMNWFFAMFFFFILFFLLHLIEWPDFCEICHVHRNCRAIFAYFSPIQGMFFTLMAYWASGVPFLSCEWEICSKNAHSNQWNSVLFSLSCDVYRYDNDDGTPKHLSPTKDVRTHWMRFRFSDDERSETLCQRVFREKKKKKKQKSDNGSET